MNSMKYLINLLLSFHSDCWLQNNSLKVGTTLFSTLFSDGTTCSTPPSRFPSTCTYSKISNKIGFIVLMVMRSRVTVTRQFVPTSAHFSKFQISILVRTGDLLRSPGDLRISPGDLVILGDQRTPIP